MYEAPIEIIQTELQMQMDGEILKAVQGVGIDVNKEELVKALAYDREQYVKGYKDGAKEFAERLKEMAEHGWIISGVQDYAVSLDNIDNLVQEMVGGENA